MCQAKVNKTDKNPSPDGVYILVASPHNLLGNY